MTWTEEDEAKFQREKAEHFAREAEADRAKANDPDSARCPMCGSWRYTETVRGEACDDCRYFQIY